jgi:UDP-N-acetylglucosamine 2-epimerase (non-hydrolysing)
MSKIIFLVAGARPNFPKIAPLYEIMKAGSFFNPVIIHTGQHYDYGMSKIFFRDLTLPKPDIYLGVGSASHAVQTARIMVKFEEACLNKKPDLIIVVGDVTSTLACSMVASKLLIPVAHVEAGLRSFDRTMPEEINRIVTDCLCDFLFTTCQDANKNLENEGISKDKIFFAGNVMIDTLLKYREKAKESKILKKLKLSPKSYALLTLHRPSNVDDKKALYEIKEALKTVSRNIPIIFPIHPRTQMRLKEFNFHDLSRIINCINPMGYLDFLSLMINSKFVLTDSGGIQEETTVLGIPCLTLRDNTERPITVRVGTNVIVGRDRNRIINESMKILSGKGRVGKSIKMWDGKAAERITKILKKSLEQ